MVSHVQRVLLYHLNILERTNRRATSLASALSRNHPVMSHPPPRKCSRFQLPDTVAGAGQVEILPVPFMPTPNLKVMRKDLDVVVRHPPFKILPRILIPSPTAVAVPPVMHYAWPADRKYLWKYAKKHKLVQYFSGRCLPKRWVDGDTLNDEDHQRGGDTEKNTEVMKHGPVDLARTREEALEAIANNLGYNAPLIISLYTNYDLYNVPSKEDIEKLRAELGAPVPQWYMRGSECFWTWNRCCR